MPGFLNDTELAHVLMGAAALVIVGTLAIVAERLVERGVRAAFERSDVPNASIFVNVLRTFIWLLAVLVVLRPVFGIDPSGLVAVLGIASVAVSLGLQDSISNVVAGLGLMLGGVVRPGDEVSVGGVSGRVEDVTWRHTVIRDRYGTSVVVPNSVLNKDSLTRRTRWNVTDGSVPVVVTPDADLASVTADVVRTVAVALEGRLDPEFVTELLFSQVTAQGYVGAIHFHVLDGESPTACADVVVRSLAGRPWLARSPLGFPSGQVGQDAATRS